MATSTRLHGDVYLERAQSANDLHFRSTKMEERGGAREFTRNLFAAKNVVTLHCSKFQGGRIVGQETSRRARGAHDQNIRSCCSHAAETRDLICMIMMHLFLCVTFLLRFWAPIVTVVASSPANIGRWDLMVENGGVSAMHMTVTYQNTVVYFDVTSGGESLMRMPDRNCSAEKNDAEVPRDCWAHAAEYTIETRDIRPLEVKTNPWCSSGSFVENGTLVQTGGWEEGYRSVRYFNPCPKGRTCDWIEAANALQQKRWYASNHILPDDRQVVVGGRGAPTYEFVPRRRHDEGTFHLDLLVETNEEGAENNLYPFVFLNSDGNLFIFANRDSILLNLETNDVVKRFPRIPGRGSRNYPSSGSAVMLPLTYEDNFHKVEVMVCGGSPPYAYQKAKSGQFLTAMDTCGRMVITDHNPRWRMGTMPGPRMLSDMLILPTGDVLLINGCSRGTAGWELGRSPVFSPYVYTPGNDPQWQILANSTIPRMYHSTAVLIPDGRVLVAGSNPNRYFKLTKTRFPTEVRIEAFSPPYLHRSWDNLRPVRVTGSGERPIVHYNEEFTVSFQMQSGGDSGQYSSRFEYRLNAPPFCTHAFSQNQRQLVLEATTMGDGTSRYASIRAPSSAKIAPAGYYMLFVVHKRVPSEGIWVQLLPKE